MGQDLISLKGATWSGVTTQTVTDRGDRRFIKLENCYVSMDGTELRHFPGWRTLIDLSDENNPTTGYSRYIHDAVRPVLDSTPADYYRHNYLGDDSRLQTLKSRAKPVSWHCFTQVRGIPLIIGESRFRENPIYDSSRNALSVTHISVSTVGGLNRWVLTFSASVGALTAADATGAGLNGLIANMVVYCENFATADAALNTDIAARLNGRIHIVKSVSLATVTLVAGPGSTYSSTAVTAGSCHVVRPNRSDSYPTPTGVDVYTDDKFDRPDDPTALTSWRIVEPLVSGDPVVECHPAWVANRQRDFDDEATASMLEGTKWSSTRGVSRREQRSLPYRVNPESAGDRLILAAPGYNCMFEVPVVVPVDGRSWPSAADDPQGITWPFNDVYDKPRALGVPKARLIDSFYTPAQVSPSDSAPQNFGAILYNASPHYGLDPGTYQVKIAFEDEATNEEGLASEAIEVTIPSNDYAYSINLNYLHPGYVMPECLALKMNVYVATPGVDTFSFFASFYLRENGSGSDIDAMSGKYGFEAGYSPGDTVGHLVRTYALPMPNSGGDLEAEVDASRLAPQSSAMPRGAEACRYIRGVLVSGGAMGNIGGSLELWASYGTIDYDAGYDANNELLIRAHAQDIIIDGSPGNVDMLAGDYGSGGFGIGGRCFPDAYQGINVASRDLFPNGADDVTIDLVKNRKTYVLSDYTEDHLRERLGLVDPLFDRIRAASTPGENLVNYDRSARAIYFRMPKGQIQIGDPGAPWRTSRPAIQVIDPTRDDDITAIGQVAGTAVICSRKETWTLSWYRSAAGETPNLLSNEYGCIAANSMVEFDGGLAWLSERGPVAIGSSLQFVGADVREWFYGVLNRRYLTDSRGMMRHAWGCHDAQRGLVMWGLVTNNNTAAMEFDGEEIAGYVLGDDEQKSRWPCDEVLIWSYRSNAFSTWRPPAGMEVLWMSPIRLGNGEIVTAFLCADGRIYYLDEVFDDTNEDAIYTTATADGTASTQLTINSAFYLDGTTTGGPAARGATGKLVREGMLVEFFNQDGNLTASTTVASATYSATVGAGIITLATAQTWKKSRDGWHVRIGGRPHMTIESNYIGAETMDNLNVQRVQVRYQLQGSGIANIKVAAIKSDLDTTTEPLTVAFTDPSAWPSLGSSDASATYTRHGRRRSWSQGNAQAPEIAVKIVVSGTAHTSISDIALEVAQ